MHHADPSGVYQPHRVGMMDECSTRQCCVHASYRQKGIYSAVKPYAALKGLMLDFYPTPTSYFPSVPPAAHPGQLPRTQPPAAPCLPVRSRGLHQNDVTGQGHVEDPGEGVRPPDLQVSQLSFIT